MAKKGRQAKAIEVPDHTCPGCGVVITGVSMIKVVDTPAVSAEAHFEIVGNGDKGEGGLPFAEGEAPKE